MVTHYNPSLRQELRYQAIPVIPLITTESLLDWLKRTGRLKPREIDLSLCLDDEIPEDLEYMPESEMDNLEEEEETEDLEE